MYLENFVEIISGKLLNNPSISLLGKITTRVSHLQSGDVFLARDKDDIPKAIQKGAYAIISTTYLEISDNEIAWILVEDIDNAILKFVKYMRLVNNIELYACNKVYFTIASRLIKDDRVKFACNIDELLECLFAEVIVVDFEILLFEVQSFNHTEKQCFSILKQTLFQTKIEYENQIYDVTIPSIFIEYLNDIVYFCKLKHFEMSFASPMALPVFINSFGKSVKYGQSMRFVYATKDKAILELYVRFVMNASWGKALLLSNQDDDFEIIKQSYNDLNEVIEYFLQNRYHFFIVYGVEQNELEQVLQDEFEERHLF